MSQTCLELTFVLSLSLYPLVDAVAAAAAATAECFVLHELLALPKRSRGSE